MVKPAPFYINANVKINVKLKNGDEYLDKDVPETPLGQHDRIVSFWHQGSVRIIPMAEVQHVDLYIGLSDSKK